MKRSSVYCFSLAAIVAGSFASCQDYDAGFSEDDIFNQKYQSAFEEAFGEIDPNQNWGFDPMPIGGVDYNGTRAVNTNSNEWETIFHYKVPGPRGGEANGNTLPWGWAAGDVTNYERAYVYWWFSTHQWPTTLVVNWNSFFMENVWGQPEHSGSNEESSANFHGEQLGMDYLSILSSTGTIKSPAPSDGARIDSYAIAKTYKSDADETNYPHVNDFNTGGGAKEQVMYLYDVSTLDFGVLTSQQDDNKIHNNWTIQQINGNYYLAFDYWHEKSTEPQNKVEADGYYNDWILKLSNGEHQDDYYTRRIMCEDLGNTFDWDWNDVVFDVTTYYLSSTNKYYAMITLQAAGGTMPIYVGDDQHEAHAMFGVSTDTPVNVDAPGHVQRPAVVYSIELTDTQLIDIGGKKYCQAEKIPVLVGSKQDPSILVTLDAEKGKAPQKFACSSTTYWMKEITHIDKGHKFTDWVNLRSQLDQQAWVQKEAEYMRHYSESQPLTAAERDVLYADAGKPSAVSYYPQGDSNSSSGEFVPWRQLWNSMVANNGLNNVQFTQARTWSKDPAGVDRSFKTQAPNIYETVGQDDDPLAFTILAWPNIKDETITDAKGTVGPFEQVWPVVVTHTLTLTAGEGGTVSGGGTYQEGSNVQISATPDFGYEFDSWSDGNTNKDRTITMSDDLSLSATFVNAYSVEVADINKTNDSQTFETLASNNYDLLSVFSSSLRAGDKCIIQLYVSNSGNVQISYASQGTPETNYQTSVMPYINPGQPANVTIPVIVDQLKITQGGDNISRILIKKKPTE